MANALRFTRNLYNVRSALAIAPQNVRLIQTTPKKQETLAAEKPKAPTTVEDFRDVSKNWVSFGFDTKDRQNDENTMHATAFITISICMVIGGFIWGYAPDPLMRDWACREAFLELRRREAAGLEPISRDFIDPAKVQLPSDEELGKMDIII